MHETNVTYNSLSARQQKSDVERLLTCNLRSGAPNRKAGFPQRVASERPAALQVAFAPKLQGLTMMRHQVRSIL
jgi:hypothetical protein